MDNTPQKQPETQFSSVHFLDYWRVLYARKEIVIAVLLLVLITGIVITRRMPRVYSSAAVIKVQREYPGVDVFQQTYGMRFDPIFLVSQFEIMRSYPVMERVVEALNLDVEMGLDYGWRDNSDAHEIRERAVGLLQRNTDLTIKRDTDLIEIRVKFDRPLQPQGEAMRRAAKVANTLANVFEDYTKAENKRRVESGLATLKDEIDDMGRRVANAESQLGSFRVKHGITLLSDLDSGMAAIRTQISQISAENNRAKIIAGVKKARYERVVELSTEEASVAIPILVGDSALSALLTSKEGIEIRVATLRDAGLGAKHPEVVQVATTLAEVNAKVAQRVTDIKTGLKLDFEQAQLEHEMYAANLATLEAQERELSSGVSVEYVNLSRELAMMKDRRMSLENVLSQQTVSMKMPTTLVTIIENARVPAKPLPISPNFTLNITLSVVAGLVFGIALAFFVEYLDTTIKSVDDIDRYISAPIVGVIPNKMRTLNRDSRSAGNSEIYRVLRMNLKSSQKLGEGKLIAFTSASAGEGKSTTVFNFAYVCAEVGEKTLILDADLHRPVQHKIVNVSSDVGLSNVVVGEATLDQAIIKTDIPNLDVLPAGQMSRFSIVGLVDTDEMRALIAELKNRYDRIVMDTPPIIGVSDTAPLVRLAEGVVQVIHHRKYPRGLCKRAHDVITNMGGNLLGIVLNNVEAAHDSSSYYYKHQYYYYYYYSGESSSSSERGSRRRRSSSKNSAYDKSASAKPQADESSRG
jgi:capsular exopolysaccharide family